MSSVFASLLHRTLRQIGHVGGKIMSMNLSIMSIAENPYHLFIIVIVHRRGAKDAEVRFILLSVDPRGIGSTFPKAEEAGKQKDTALSCYPH